MSTTAEKAIGGYPAIFFEATNPEYAGRYDFSTPFWAHGRIYATDGRIIVRRPEPNAIEFQGTSSLKPDVSLMFGEDETSYSDACEIPSGLQQHRITTDFHRCHRGWERTETARPNDDRVVVRDGKHRVDFAAYYLALLAKHGVKELRLRPGVKAIDHQAYFQGPDFDGLLMPLKSTKDP